MLYGAGHSTPSTGDSGQFRSMATAWFLYQLAGDQKAAAMFKEDKCGYCADPRWAIQKKGVE